jgi:hypothetical protein
MPRSLEPKIDLTRQYRVHMPVRTDAVKPAASEGKVFASAAAEKEAKKAGLSPEDLAASGQPSGQSGYTVADVRRAAETR